VVGGAAINRGYGRRILFVEEETPYEPGVYYAQDAFEGLSIMDHLADPDQREPFRRRILAEAFDADSRFSGVRMIFSHRASCVSRPHDRQRTVPWLGGITPAVNPQWGHFASLRLER
jgi:cobalamin-dependent methionine synthase I